MNPQLTSKIILLGCICLLLVGCGTNPAISKIDHQLARAERHSKAAALTPAEIHGMTSNLNRCIRDSNISDGEKHRIAESIGNAIVNSGNIFWLHDFYRNADLDGEFGYDKTMTVWRFAVDHPCTFFSSSVVDDFWVESQNIEIAFAEKTEVQLALNVLDDFSNQSVGDAKRHAQKWASALREVLAEGAEKPLP